VVEITGLTMADTLDRVSHLPDDTIVWTLGLFVDGAGLRFVPNDTIRAISARANRPVFALATSSIGTGIVGGYLTDFGAEARAAAKVAARTLEGVPISGAQAVEAVAPLPIFDWRELRRWNIRERDLPPGSLVRFRGPSFLERYGFWLALAVLQTGFIAGLLIERRARRRASRAAAASESLNRSVIASLPGMIAIVDQAGVVLKTNQAWREQGLLGPGVPLASVGPGMNCRELCAASSGSSPLAARALQAVTDVLERRVPAVSFEYPQQVSGDDRWYKMSVQLLDRAEGGAVIAFTDITARKVAEFEGVRTLQQAARASRVTTMGELAASLAHEINQPLAAILANAQAASRLLAVPSPNLELVRETIDDIARNDRRAGEIIRRMRGMLQKGETERVPVLLNDVARDVLALLGPEASLRRVTLESWLGPDLPALIGDPIQLQQVVLNLVMNAVDAVGQAGASERFVLVSTRADGPVVELSVRDRGTGIDAAALPNVFNAFFTTKSTGLGMGLSISRSIVEAHGGRITAENNEGGGATFTCRFPRATESAA
jgi:signal transduction histidine kinase